MKTEPELHANRHAKSTRGHDGKYTVVSGYLLEPGDVLEATDLYDSTSGVWEPCPCPGLALGDGTGAVWIRPEKP